MRRRPALFPPDGRTAAPPPSAFPATYARTTEKRRGRVERRTLESTSILTVFDQWPGLTQGFRITREVTHRGRTTVEVVHGITSLPRGRADAAHLLRAVRNHWQIENQLHYVRDVTLGEDACRVRTGNAPQNLAACRNAAVCLLARVPSDNRADAIRRLAARPDAAIALINSKK